jgi:hypothetical protein
MLEGKEDLGGRCQVVSKREVKDPERVRRPKLARKRWLEKRGRKKWATCESVGEVVR